MESITELGKIEAKIFKKGSGAGSNLSNLRSSKEPVRGGGNASGPVSFLKAHDVSAGVIRSGGTLRRSAKLSCLNIDHPDIEEFIDCKIFEEEKLAILKKAGVKNRPGYDLADEVYFQNTNLSVRIPDEFMKKVLEDGMWDTKFVKTKETYKTYKARDLLRKIAETSHKIADPGVMFHDAFNKWNTLANDGTIESTNPCGEYASLHSTSCNLASINLMRFFSKDINNNIIFDYETYKDVIRTVITGQDILIDKSGFPSLDIGLRSAAYRNLGLGYTNLGGLLMWLGVPYDSDEGRFIASRLTALMTGLAYETSADLADKIGPFIKFKDNEQSFRNILNQHFNIFYESYQNVEPTKEYLKYISKMCYDTWSKVIERKQFRNAQVSLLAPTGCLKGDSYILTSSGINELKDLSPTPEFIPNETMLEKDRWKNIDLRVLQENSIQDASHFYYNGVQETLKIVSEEGYSIEGTLNHKIRIITSCGAYVWRKLDELKVGDHLVIRKGGHEDLLKNKPYIELNNTGINIQKCVLDEKLAFILGCYISGGDFYDKGLKFIIPNNNHEFIASLEDKLTEFFNIEKLYCCDIKYNNNTNIYFANSNTAKEFFKLNDFVKNKEFNRDGSTLSSIPKQILQSKTSVLCSFLRGLFDINGIVYKTESIPIIEYCAVSEKLSRQLQVSLLSLGISTTIIEQNFNDTKIGLDKNCKKKLFKVYISSLADIETFKTKIGFTDSWKQDILENYDDPFKHCSNFLKGKLAWENFKNQVEGVIEDDKKSFALLKTTMGHFLYWAEEMLKSEQQLRIANISKINEQNISISRIKSIQKSKCETFDLSVPVDNTYIANGFVSHNTISFLMNSITTGIEPEYSLVRYKRLVGSGNAVLKTVNPLVEDSLRNLGYSESEIPELIKELIEPTEGTKTKFRNNDRNVFLTAAAINESSPCIPYMGHVKMCAAVQPFLSGAISKTINLPKDCTIDDVYNLYIESWKMGLKGVTIYRDGSKNFQPLSSTTCEKEKTTETKLTRKRLPDERLAITHKFKIGSSEGYITCGMYNESNALGEVFINVSKEGSTLSGFADALATIISISLQYGVPLKDLVRKLSHLKFEPSGFTQNQDIRIAHSIVDYIARYLGLKFLSKEDKIELGLIPAKNTNGILLECKEIKTTTYNEIGPECSNCSSIMRRLGNCYFCTNCGYNQGSCG